MEQLERISLPYTIGLNLPPIEADIAIISKDIQGETGQLNIRVLQQYGYNIKDLRLGDRLIHGFTSIGYTDRKPILVTDTDSQDLSGKNLEKNLFNALVEYRGWYYDKKIWLTLMATGEGGLNLRESYAITVRTINRAYNEFNIKTTVLLSIPDSEEGKELYNELSGEKPEETKAKEAGYFISQIKGKFYLVGAYWGPGNDQTETFVKQQMWEKGQEDNSYTEIINRVNPGDILIIKSTFHYDGISYLKIKAIGIVIENLHDGASLGVDWRITDLNIDIAHLGFYRNTITAAREDDVITIFLKINSNLWGKLLLPITKPTPVAENQNDSNSGTVSSQPQNDEPGVKEIAELINNKLQHAGINNDGAQSENDMLGFKNDIRAFAALIALKELKPPLAIALFGKWGSGKSFFIYNLQKKIDFLSKHQGFEELVEKKEATNTNDEPFCKGVVQITFNAWAYMDANLWASLAANIFEKLDEYINNETKGDNEKRKAREVISNKLTIVNNEKAEVINKRKELLKEKDELIEKVTEIEKKKKELLENAAQKKYSEIYEELKKKITLEQDVVDQLEKYGINNQLIGNTSPETVYSEVKSWVRFLSNLFQFSEWQLTGMALAALLLLFVLLDPLQVVDRYLNYAGSIIASLGALAGPLVYSFYTTLNKFLKLYQPVKEYKDKFNKELEDIRLQYEKEMREVNEKISLTNNELSAKTEQLNNLSQKIEIIEYELGNSITGKAFFDFIRSRSKDERYDKSLGIITTIRRDFETLSELFRDYNIPAGLSNKEMGKAIEKKQKIAAFKDLFTKPLDRIVLYVDDLDRCPEERVIEVLEAVNLLMAFPLFVVVVGVDPRWVKNALIKKYTLQFTGKFNSNDELKEYGVEPIHVTDYLEKIFQVPFYLREADKKGISDLINDILGSQVKKEIARQSNKKISTSTTMGMEMEAAGVMQTTLSFTRSETVNIGGLSDLVNFKPEDLKLSRQELDDLTQVAWLVGSNPRSLKRFINIYRIIRAHENLTYGSETERENFLAIMFILGLNIGEYKHQAKNFCDTCFSKPEDNLQLLLNALEKLPERDLATDIGRIQLPAQLMSITGKNFNEYIPFVKRFSFDNPAVAG